MRLPFLKKIIYILVLQSIRTHKMIPLFILIPFIFEMFGNLCAQIDSCT